MKRTHISLKTKLAAALLQLRFPELAEDGSGKIRFLKAIDYEHAKQMTAEQIISLFHLDHDPIPHAEGGPDEAWNLTFLFIGEHRQKTKRDVAAMAKARRIVDRLAKLNEISNRQFADVATPASPLRKRKWPSRKFPKRPSRRLRSGGV